ncbi:MAG TPA: hypothetical protein VGC67_06720 [Cellulomonas sp.]
MTLTGHDLPLAAPAGDPEGVAELAAELAARWRACAQDVEDAAERLDAVGDALHDMDGAAADAARDRVADATSRLALLGTVLTEAAEIMDAFGRALDQEQQAAGTASHDDEDAHDEYDRQAALLRSLAAAPTGPVLPTGRTGQGFQDAVDRTRASTAQEHARIDESGAVGRWQAACDAIDQAAGDATARLAALDHVSIASTSGAIVTSPVPWQPHTSLEDYLDGYRSWALSHLPGAAGHEDTIAAAVWAMGQGQGVLTAGGKAWRYSLNLSGYVRLLSSGGAEAGDLLEALTRQGMVRRTIRSAQMWAVGKVSGTAQALVYGAAEQQAITPWALGRGAFSAASTSGASTTAALGEGALTAARSMGVLKTLGVAGSAVATVGSAVNVASQGWPWDAYEANGIDYVADVAEVAFNASLTAAMVCPNPVTLGLAVGTGVAYGVTEVVAHWDEITTLVSDGLDAAADLLDGAGDAIGDAVDEGIETAKKVGSWTTRACCTPRQARCPRRSRHRGWSSRSRPRSRTAC